MAFFGTKCRLHSPTLSNPYLGSERAITYSVTKMPDGWRIQAEMPKHVSPLDRTKVLDWFHDYRSQVRRTNPFWLASFHVIDDGYALEIRPTHDVRQLAEAGEKVKEIWDDTLKHAQR
jgi:hypothetical protein